MKDKEKQDNIPVPKYYGKWGMPARPPREHFSRDDWSFREPTKKRLERYVPPAVWNQIVHELLYSESSQRAIADKLGAEPKYVRTVVAGINKMIPVLERTGNLGPGQRQILDRKLKKRQTQATIHRALKVSRQRISDSISLLEKKFEKTLNESRGGVDRYWIAERHEPVATPDVNPDYGPKIDIKTCVQLVEGVRARIEKKRKYEGVLAMNNDPFFNVPNTLVEKSADDRMELRMSKAVEAFISDYAEACGVTREAFIENGIVDLMARVHIRSLMHVGHPFGPLVHLIKLDDRLLRDQELFEWLVQYYEDDLDLDAAEPTPQDHEAQKERLAEYNTMQMEIERGRIPADYEGAPGPALSWLAEFDRGEITAEQLRERWEAHKKYAGWGK